MTDDSAEQPRRAIARARADQVSFDLDSLLRAASWLWPGPTITGASVARAVGLRPNHLTDIAQNRALHVTFKHLGLITWYFGAEIDLFLKYRPLQDDGTMSELKRDLALISQGLLPAELPTARPQLARREAPAGPPGPGSIVVINRLPMLLSSMPHNEIAQLTGRSKNNISRYAHAPITRIARSTLTELLEAFVLTDVSAILNVRLDLDNYSDTGKPAPDAVHIESLMPVWKSVDWQHVVQQWRRLADIRNLGRSELSDIDVVAIQYIYTLIAANQGGRAPRLGGQFASALNVSRETISSVVNGDFRPHITTLDLPRPVRDFIHQTLQLPSFAQSGQDKQAEPADAPASTR